MERHLANCVSLAGHYVSAPVAQDDPRIFEGRRLAEEPMMVELADEFGVSRERVRQIEARAFEKVQNAVKNRVAAIETAVQKSMH